MLDPTLVSPLRPRALMAAVGVGFLLFAVSSPAGVLLTKSHQAEVGNLVESETSVSIQSQYGSVEHKKDQLLWFSILGEVDTLLKAAQKAQADGNRPAAQVLYELSVAKEPATAAQANSELETLKTQLIKNPTGSAPAVDAGAAGFSGAMTSEEKIARGRQMISRGQDMLRLRSSTMTAQGAAMASNTAQRNIADGQKLVAEGEKELAEVRAKQAEEIAKAQEIRQIAAESFTWTQEEKMVNAGLAIGLALIVLIALWQLTMKEPKR